MHAWLLFIESFKFLSGEVTNGSVYIRMKNSFRDISILLPATDEVYSLKITFDILIQENRPDISEVIFILGKNTTKRCRMLCDELVLANLDFCRVLDQTRPFLGGAIRDGFKVAKGSHVLLMASDLETDPHAVSRLIKESRLNPNAIVTATRWKFGGGFRHYGSLKIWANFIFQKIFSFLFNAKVTDLTYGFRVFPTELVNSIHWTSLRHPFLFETIVKPIRMGVKVIEVPVIWQARQEGQSKNSFAACWGYIKVGVYCRVLPIRVFLK